MKTNETTLTHGFAKKQKSAFTLLVERAYANYLNSTSNSGTIAYTIESCFATMKNVQHTSKRRAFRGLLLHLESQGCYALLRNESSIYALANIASFSGKFVDEIVLWKNTSIEVETQMSTIIKHCFAKYEVPEFLENVFYGENKVHMYWYVQLGRGDSVSKLGGFPIKLTKKIAFEFRNVPENYTVSQAIRWAQAKGLGASVTMAETLSWSTLSETFENESFWETVVLFFSKYDKLPFDKVQEVLFYIKENFLEDHSFTTKGRTWEALVKQSDEWHIEYYKRQEAINGAQWKLSGINEFRKCVTVGDETFDYSVIELTNSEALYEEGYEMSHCVAEYEYDCIEGITAIFSIRKFSAAVVERLATIEVNLDTKYVEQAKARCNEPISAEAQEILEKWANTEKLILNYEEVYIPPVNENVNVNLPRENAYVPPPYEHQVPQYQNELPHYDRRDYHTDTGFEIDWKIVLYLFIFLVKTCSLLSRH